MSLCAGLCCRSFLVEPIKILICIGGEREREREPCVVCSRRQIRASKRAAIKCPGIYGDSFPVSREERRFGGGGGGGGGGEAKWGGP